MCYFTFWVEFFCTRSLHSVFVLGILHLQHVSVSVATVQILSSHVVLRPPYWTVQGNGYVLPTRPNSSVLKRCTSPPLQKEFCGQISGGNSGFIKLNVSLEQNFLEPSMLKCIVTLQEKYTVCSVVQVYVTSQVRNPGTHSSVCWRRGSKKPGGRQRRKHRGRPQGDEHHRGWDRTLLTWSVLWASGGGHGLQRGHWVWQCQGHRYLHESSVTEGGHWSRGTEAKIP